MGTLFGIALFVIDISADQRFWPGVVIVYLVTTGLLGWDLLYAVFRRSTISPKDVVPPPS